MEIRRRLVLPGIALLALLAVGPYLQSVDAQDAQDARRLAEWHELLCSEPHVAGTEGDRRHIKLLADAFESMGLETEVHEFTAYLPQPVEATLEITSSVSIGGSDGATRRRGVIPLPLSETNLLEDPSVQHPGLTYGWNAYSATGDVTAEVVYANHGTYEDFERLRELGVDVNGKIVIARYGRNYRGYKVKYAQEAGAAGLLMYLDPGDYGEGRGKTWPAGGWANSSCIQRGSVLVLPYKGDPLTPFVEATEDAERLNPDHVAFPWIPVQPIGYAAASRIFTRMKGRLVEDDDWNGGFDFTYPLEGGEDLKVHLAVEQDLQLRRSANVIGRIEGAVHPDQFVVVGCHHDAWGYGAADPLAGSIVLMETARAFAEAAARGERPDRTILFAAWGAEEFGIIGSTEWVEAHAEEVAGRCVGYVNLDMAAMGPNFNSSATPVLRRVIAEAVASVPQAAGEAGRTLAETLVGDDGPSFGELGGGSDHVAFVCHVGIPAMRLGGSGAPGVAYHSNYDTLTWYRSTVGADYEPALMVTRACTRVVDRLANDPLPPYEWVTVAGEVLRHARNHLAKALDAGMKVDLAGLSLACSRLERSAARLDESLRTYVTGQDQARDRRISNQLLAAERIWVKPEGLDDRPWYRNTYISDDPRSGYGASPLPELEAALRARNADRFGAAVAACANQVDRLSDRLDALRADIGSESTSFEPSD